MSALDDAKSAAGELLLVGFQGLELSDETSAFLSQAKIGGVILFAANYENPAQVAELVSQVQESRGDLPLWVAVDHEGGKVQRFRKGFTRIPDAQLIGRASSPKLTFEIAELAARELRSVGVNVNFCPVADIQTNPRNPVIGPRSYGETEELVSKMVTAVVRGHLVSGVQPCVKHFPGHGDTNLDSHLALPKVDTPRATLLEREVKPFIRAFKSRCAMVMTAHIVNPSLDPERPATLSAATLRELLRKELRYSRLIVSDDMEMKAIADHYGAVEAPVLALEAGCDVLIYRTEAAGRAAYEAIQRALDSGRLAPQTVLEAASRSRALKREALLPYQPVVVADVAKSVGLPASLELVRKIDPSIQKA